MKQLEEKLVYLEDISKLEESVLEIRRFEKNYFLYGNNESLKTALYYLSRVKEILNKDYDRIEALSSKVTTGLFRDNLETYEKATSSCLGYSLDSKCKNGQQTKADLETTIRKAGSQISEFAETVVHRKRLSISHTIDTTMRLQFITFALMGLGLISVGGFLSVKVMKPLKLLEQSTYGIARGQFKPIDYLPAEKDIREIFISFNRMASELKVREDQLVQSRKLASLGTMLAGVAHEINNPLSNISSSCEILLEELEEADTQWQKGLLKKMLEQVDKARGIVLNLLEFSRSKEFLKEWFNLNNLLEGSIDLLQGQMPAKVKISRNIDKDLRIFGDKTRLQQAFINLLSNAVQAVDEQGEVSVTARKFPDESVRVQIKDTGKGIAEENISKIFDPFFTTKDVGHGTGLGLFITHEIITRHNGTISVKSQLDKGTTFTVHIPSQEPTNEQSA
jgi:signal transduction histidine kinase